MSFKKVILLSSVIFAAFFNLNLHAQTAENPETAQDPEIVQDLGAIEKFTAGMKENKGFFTFYSDEKKGKTYLKIDRFDQEFLYQVGISTGVGSNDIGLDNKQLGSNHLVTFQRVGEKIFLHQKNLKFRAISDSKKERTVVKDAFATAILWGFKVVVSTDNAVLIDMSDFLITDHHGVAAKLKAGGHGSFSADKSRSGIYAARTKSFPKNTEFETIMTFKGTAKSQYLRSVAANNSAITLRQHLSFIKLPDDKYRPRAFHVGSGFFAGGYKDYAVKIEDNMEVRYIYRHRLIKKNPEAAMSEPVQPIVYYVDGGVPEPIRSALIEGALWWNESFKKAGFINAFQVKILPDDADPMDIRYNVINWVHRSTRGWSYGDSISDPRTGEILKGNVSLGSLRVRQDFLIASALTAPYTSENPDISKEKEMALARIRQLSAHEVGHTIGLAHNYIASGNKDSEHQRTSVMDYPHPRFDIIEGKIELKNAYGDKIGQWDNIAIRYGYSEFKKGTNEKAALAKILKAASDRGLHFITDQDARGISNIHADSHLWDNGKNGAEELARIYEVRKIGLKNFSENNIAFGEPLSRLEEVLVPLYYMHRYQLDAAGKSIGGMRYFYALRGTSSKTPYKIVPAEEQRRALNVILESLKPEFLALSEHILSLIPPRAFEYGATRESFPRHTGKSFGALAMTEAGASHALSILLNNQRMARIYEFSMRDGSQITMNAYIDLISGATVKADQSGGLKSAVHRRVNHVYIHHLMLLAQNPQASEAVRSLVSYKLSELMSWMSKQSRRLIKDKSYASHYRYEASRVAKFLAGEYKPTKAELAKMPPGSPI